MSIVCVARKNGEIAISGDSLTKYGSTSASSSYRANSSKLYRVNGSVIGLASAMHSAQCSRPGRPKSRRAPSPRQASGQRPSSTIAAACR
jgi:hypothetical protein